MPNRTGLAFQTETRIAQLIKRLGDFEDICLFPSHADDDAHIDDVAHFMCARCVCMPLPFVVFIAPTVARYAESGSDTFEKFLQSASEHPDVLHCLIADECHWAMGVGGNTRRYLLNDELIRADNIMTILVSATPENHFTANGRLPYVDADKVHPPGDKQDAAADHNASRLRVCALTAR